MDIAIITEANTSVSLSIANKLNNLGIRVYALDLSFSDSFFSNKGLIPVSCDLTNPEQIASVVQAIIEKEGNINFLIHNQQISSSALMPNALDITNQKKWFDQFLTGPLILSEQVLPHLCQVRGMILCIHWSYVPSPSPAESAIYGAFNAFNKSIHRHYENKGVRVTTLYPHLTQDNRFNPIGIADTVDCIIRHREDMTITEVSIYPNRVASANELLPRLNEFTTIFLPPEENFPPIQDPIPTTQPTYIQKKWPKKKSIPLYSKDKKALDKTNDLPQAPSNLNEKQQAISRHKKIHKTQKKAPVTPESLEPKSQPLKKNEPNANRAQKRNHPRNHLKSIKNPESTENPHISLNSKHPTESIQPESKKNQNNHSENFVSSTTKEDTKEGHVTPKKKKTRYQSTPPINHGK